MIEDIIKFKLKNIGVDGCTLPNPLLPLNKFAYLLASFSDFKKLGQLGILKFGGKKIFLETNIFDIKKNLYKKKLRVFFLKFIRKDRKFDSSRQLIRQMNKDVIIATKGLKTKLVL